MKKDLVKDVIGMGITKTSQIQRKILTMFHVPISKRSIRRYKAEITEDALIEQVNSNEGNKGNVINPKTVQVLTPKKGVKLEKKYDIVIHSFPFWLHCPICRHGMKLESNPIQSCECWQCGIAYSRRDKCFIDMRTGEIIKKISIFDPVLNEQ